MHSYRRRFSQNRKLVANTGRDPQRPPLVHRNVLGKPTHRSRLQPDRPGAVPVAHRNTGCCTCRGLATAANNPITRLQLRHHRPALHDLADKLVAHHRPRIDHPVLEPVHIRSANARVLDLDQYLVRARFWSRNILNRNLLSPTHYRSFHGYAALSLVPVMFASPVMCASNHNFARTCATILSWRIILRYALRVKTGKRRSATLTDAEK